MVLQTPTGHELVDEKPVFVFDTVPDELYKIRVRQLSKVIHFSLRPNEQHVIHGTKLT